VRKHAVVQRQVTTRAVKRPDTEPGYRHLPPLLNEYVETVEVPECSKVYTYVEQMPTLNGQPVMAASVAAITQRLILPSNAPDGRIFVKFEVSCEGWAAHPQILKGLRADVDSAVVAATRQLPRFTPGKQNGRVVTVNLTLPITIPVKKQP
jgi:protein TonB